MKSKIITLILYFAFFAMITPEKTEKMYAPDGRSLTVYVSDAESYKKLGWYEQPVKKMYNPTGKSSIVYASKARAYRQVGWYDEPVTYIYSLNGKKTVVYEKDLSKREKEGWRKEPFAIMTKDDVSQYVVQSQIQKYRADGWTVSRFYSSLYELGLQIEQYISKKHGSFGIYIKNLNTDDSLIINDGQFSSASIIKLFVMAEIYNEIDKGNIEYNQSIYSNLWSMITVSDNASSNRLVKAIGGNYLNGFNRENKFSHSIGCFATQHMSLFAEYGDYVSYGKNLVSPMDCGIVLEKIYNKSLVSETYSNEMLNLLKNQKRRNKIPYLLPTGTVCANKTGENDRVQSDVGIVYSPNCDYIICVLTNNAPTGINDIREISKMTYNYFN